MTQNVIDFNIWFFLAGLGIFLFGMHNLEIGLEGLAGKSFKRMLHGFTDRKYKGIITGTVITAILQSSSLVNLIVLALLGVKMIAFQHSLGVLLGANLGTTATAWIVAAIGFKVSISKLSFPFLAIGILSYLLMKRRPVIKNTGLFLMGFGLLFLGLDYMKASVESLPRLIDIRQYAETGLFVFLLTGIVITAIIQSSSATIVMVLSLFNSGLIDAYQSVSLIIGANIGTTSTVILASIGGTPDKKRLAAANVIFNLVAGGISFVFMKHMVLFAQMIFNDDMLMGLVLINTMINLTGIILFYPFLENFGGFLKKLFMGSETKGSDMHIRSVSPEITDLAINALREDVKYSHQLAGEFIIECLGIKDAVGNPDNKLWKKIFSAEPDLNEKYIRLKAIADDITIFYRKIQEHSLEEKEITLISSYMEKLRSVISAAKNIKDIAGNIREMEGSEDVLVHNILNMLRDFVLRTVKGHYPEELAESCIMTSENCYRNMEQFYRDTIEYLYKNLDTDKERDIPLSTITNVIRKTVSSVEEFSVSGI
ncbi:MAG: Na/Pi symporter [Deltaproteobacteria bacterium]|nr:Na/Pi symporter [Deltaproteobacteria bacterium]